jgi:hypothetical protein
VCEESERKSRGRHANSSLPSAWRLTVVIQQKRNDSGAVESPDPGSPHEKNLTPISPSTGCGAVAQVSAVKISVIEYSKHSIL